MDYMALNFNPSASKLCIDCCKYADSNSSIASNIIGAWCYNPSNEFEFYDNGKFYHTIRKNIYSGFWHLSKKTSNKIILEYDNGDLLNLKIISQYKIKSQNHTYTKCNN